MVKFFYRFTFLSVDFFDDYFRLSHLKFIAFASMVSMSTLRWSTPRPNTIKESALKPGSTRKARFFLQFFIKTLFDVTGSHVFTVFAEEWGIIDGEQHTHGRFVNGYGS